MNEIETEPVNETPETDTENGKLQALMQSKPRDWFEDVEALGTWLDNNIPLEDADDQQAADGNPGLMPEAIPGDMPLDPATADRLADAANEFRENAGLPARIKRPRGSSRK